MSTRHPFRVATGSLPLLAALFAVAGYSPVAHAGLAPSPDPSPRASDDSPHNPAPTDAADSSAAFDQPVDGAKYIADLESWIYGSRNWLMPGAGALAFVPTAKLLFDERLNLRMHAGGLDVDLLPRLVGEHAWSGTDAATGISGTAARFTLPQAFVRLEHGSTTVVAGREVLAWGPSSFRSPSNPFYFDAGRTRPLELTPGIDLTRFTQQAESLGLTVAYVHDDRHVDTQGQVRRAALAKVDEQGDSHLVSVVGAWTWDAAGRQNVFLGSFAQFTPSDAWLLYGEAGVQQQRDAATGAQAQARAALAGTKYTNQNGLTFDLEYLYNDNGSLPAGVVPRLADHHYAWMSWQSNPQETRLSWRVEYQANLDDGSRQLLCYVERNVSPAVNVFLSFAGNLGSSRSEYASIARGSAVLGVKVFGF